MRGARSAALAWTALVAVAASSCNDTTTARQPQPSPSSITATEVEATVLDDDATLSLITSWVTELGQAARQGPDVVQRVVHARRSPGQRDLPADCAPVWAQALGRDVELSHYEFAPTSEQDEGGQGLLVYLRSGTSVVVVPAVVLHERLYVVAPCDEVLATPDGQTEESEVDGSVVAAPPVDQQPTGEAGGDSVSGPDTRGEPEGPTNGSASEPAPPSSPAPRPISPEQDEAEPLGGYPYTIAATAKCSTPGSELRLTITYYVYNVRHYDGQDANFRYWTSHDAHYENWENATPAPGITVSATPRFGADDTGELFVYVRDTRPRDERTRFVVPHVGSYPVRQVGPTHSETAWDRYDMPVEQFTLDPATDCPEDGSREWDL